MEQTSSWVANSNSASQEIPCLLWNPKVHYRVHNSPPLIPVLDQMHPVHTFPPFFPKIPSNIILPSTPRSSKWSLPFRSPPPQLRHWRSWVSCLRFCKVDRDIKQKFPHCGNLFCLPYRRLRLGHICNTKNTLLVRSLHKVYKMNA
jgi:hypothetical protein